MERRVEERYGERPEYDQQWNYVLCTSNSNVCPRTLAAGRVLQEVGEAAPDVEASSEATPDVAEANGRRRAPCVCVV